MDGKVVTSREGNVKDCADKGLLVVSFGTTHNDTCRETIGAIEEHLAKAMPDRSFYRAWTSSFIIRKLKERDGVEVDTVGEALERMASDGIRDVLIVPTHLLPGAEYDKVMKAVEDAYEEDRGTARERVDAGNVRAETGDSEHNYTFEKIAVSRPLLDTDEDLKRLAEVIAGELIGSSSDASPAGDSGLSGITPSAGDSDPIVGTSFADPVPKALVLMGHGSADKPEVNRVYVKLEEEFRRTGFNNVFVGTVEGIPSLDDVIEKLKDWWHANTEAGTEVEGGVHILVGEDQNDIGSMDGTPKTDDMAVLLTPLMIVAGDHAINDMAGDDPDSWKNRIAASLMTAGPSAVNPSAANPSAADPSAANPSAVNPSAAGPSVAAGAEVIPIIRGLGSYPGVQDMFLGKTGNAVVIHK